MGELNVSSVTVEELLKKLKHREWQIPQFQRDFVWSVSDVIDLVHSVLCARPIGMATIWEQAESNTLELAPISLVDKAAGSNENTRIEFSDVDSPPNKMFAVLDGLQRCTALAMSFGGFHSQHGSYKHSGRYYINVVATDPLEQIVFIKEREVKTKSFDTDAACISQGLFPLASNDPNEGLLQQWMRYLQAVQNPNNYPGGILPADSELGRRDKILKTAFEGLTRTKLAVYIVPDDYTLADICEIFEKLNTTGTKVSTVDLIHSWLYSDTVNDSEGAVLLRDWIDDFGQLDGAIGWASSDDRPELTVQMVTACYVAMDQKAEPRQVGRGEPAPISSVKASDLLATPTLHWKKMMQMQSQLASYLGDFQKTVAEGYFPWKSCPYPVTSAIYVALRVHAELDSTSSLGWKEAELQKLFRAFFWLNALSNRYDQGFLTQLGADIKELKRILATRAEFESIGAWAKESKQKLMKLIAKPLPDRDELLVYLTDGRPGGALQKALLLPMVARAKTDILDETLFLGFPDSSSGVQLHHIYPKSWCANNKSGDLAHILDSKIADRDFANSISNLMPLSRQSNNSWKAKVPAQALEEAEITFLNSRSSFERAFIDEEAYQQLLAGPTEIKKFWEHRASTIAADLLDRTELE